VYSRQRIVFIWLLPFADKWKHLGLTMSRNVVNPAIVHPGLANDLHVVTNERLH
jgi:hypothetical protein